MKIKKISGIIMCALSLSLAACVSPTNTNSSTQNSTTNTNTATNSTTVVTTTVPTTTVIPTTTVALPTTTTTAQNQPTTTVPTTTVVPTTTTTVPTTTVVPTTTTTVPSTTTNSSTTTSSTTITSSSTVNTSSSTTINIPDNSEIKIISVGGYNEAAYVEFESLNLNSSSYKVSYKLDDNTSYTEVDNELIRVDSSLVRCDLLGLKAGTYSIKVEANNLSTEITNVKVSSLDRSGYAHFKYSTGVGAYNNDGTLKSNTTVVYVTEENKNTVTAKINGSTYTGIGNILKNQSKSSNPLVIRIIGRIGAASWGAIDYSGSSLYSSSIIGANNKPLTKDELTESEIISGGFNSLNTATYSQINGLTNKIKYTYETDKTTGAVKKDEFDSYYNMMDVSGAKNVTVEGVGVGAEIYHWGFTWKKCNSIEVKNLTFTDYPEDACSFEGNSGNVTENGNYWVHNNTFNAGKNYWDVTFEQDKPAGDGATDFKYCEGITSSYNTFNKCKKTGLIGGSDSNLTKDVTFHHNFYNQVGSRLPLGRQANMHIYNNYYYKCGTAQDIRANAFVLSEYNYFEGVSNPQLAKSNAVIKSFNDYLTGSGSSQATVVTARDKTLSGSCKPDGSTDYSNFDIDSNKFYYDSTNKKSDVAILTSVMDVPTFVKTYAGSEGYFNALDYTNVAPSVPDTGDEEKEEDPTPEVVTESTLITFDSLSKASGITTNLAVDNATIYATSSKTVSVAEKEMTIGNTTVSKYIDLSGGGAIDYRSISFTTAKKANITVYFFGGSGRYLALKDGNNAELGLSTATTNGELDTYTYEGIDANTLYLMSTGSGIKVYGILIEYVE